jgi:hypothetical protein
MKPITFHCEAVLPQSAADIADQMLDLARWQEFSGYALLPGIASAAWEVQVPGIVGSRIRVQNRDGSSHVEEILTWQPDRELQLRFTGFSPPVSRLATSFLETWHFQPHAQGTHVRRSMELYAKHPPGRCVLWCISFFLKKVLARHLDQLREAAVPAPAAERR